MTKIKDHPLEALARLVTSASGAGRLAIGIGMLAAPRETLSALGFSDPGPATLAVARVAGGRDLAMGVETLAALASHDRPRLARANAMNASADAGDALTFAAALIGGAEEVRDAGRRGLPGAGIAAIAGAAAFAWFSRGT